MTKVVQYAELLRVRHWIKNGLVFVPLFYKQKFFDPLSIRGAVFCFICFSLLASIVYIFNDIQDIEKDRLHNTKCRRPVASGNIPVRHAVIAITVLVILLIALLLFFSLVLRKLDTPFFMVAGLMALYMLLNIAYSRGLKNIPIVDITILASGYVIRVIAGAVIIGSDVSVWLYLVITLGAYYMGLGKRRNEVNGSGKETRAVMRFYSHNFLDKNMYICQTLCVVFYALWSFDPVTVQTLNTSAFAYTIPLIFIILLKYSLNIETDNDGDPTSVFLHDKVLMLLCALYIVCAFSIIYMNRSIL